MIASNTQELRIFPMIYITVYNVTFSIYQFCNRPTLRKTCINHVKLLNNITFWISRIHISNMSMDNVATYAVSVLLLSYFFLLFSYFCPTFSIFSILLLSYFFIRVCWTACSFLLQHSTQLDVLLESSIKSTAKQLPAYSVWIFVSWK